MQRGNSFFLACQLFEALPHLLLHQSGTSWKPCRQPREKNECVALNHSRAHECLNIATKLVDSRFVNIAASPLAPRAAYRAASLRCGVTRLETGSCSYKTSAGLLKLGQPEMDYTVTASFQDIF